MCAPKLQVLATKALARYVLVQLPERLFTEELQAIRVPDRHHYSAQPTFLQAECTALRQHLQLPNFPANLHEPLCRALFDGFERAEHDAKAKYRTNIGLVVVTQIMRRLYEAAIGALSYMQYFNSEYPFRLSAGCVSHLLPRFADMRHLNLRTWHGCAAAGAEQLVLAALPQMPQLKVFYLFKHATDAIVQKLAACCPHLNHLDLERSELVTDESVPALIAMQRMRSLCLRHTRLSAWGAADVFPHLPQLQVFAPCASGNARIVAMACLQHPERAPFRLSELTAKSGLLNSEQVEQIVAGCPFIESVVLSIRVSGHACDLEPLCRLKGLWNLELKGGNYWNVDRVQRTIDAVVGDSDDD